jgi:PRTRC genetic system protein B
MPTVEIEGESALVLTTALLVYENKNSYDRGKAAVVTQHDVTAGMIQPGSPLDLGALRKLLDRGDQVAALGQSHDYAWQFPRIIAEGRERIVWWSPSGIKSVFIGSEGEKKPKVVQAWIPQLIWSASRRHTHCYLWACHDTDSPGPHTSVYLPQFGGHIHHDASICVGSTKIDGHTPEAWEKGFWSSRFKTAGNLKSTKPYAIQEKFKALGTLASVLPRSRATD